MVSAAVTLRVFKVPEKTPSSSLVKVPSVIAITCFLGLSRGDRPLRCLVRGDRIGRRYHPELLASARSTAEDPGGGKICSAAAARRPACRAGEIFPATGLGPAPAGSSSRETCRDGPAEKPERGGRLAHARE